MKKKPKLNSKTNYQINKSIYNWIMHHSKVVQSPIFNDCLKVNNDGNPRPQSVPKLLLQASIRELHNSLVSDPDKGGIK